LAQDGQNEMFFLWTL